MIVSKNVMGTQEKMPLATDTLSSPTTVYLRENVKRETDDNGFSYWTYDETAMTREEWHGYEIGRNQCIYDSAIMELLGIVVKNQIKTDMAFAELSTLMEGRNV